MTSSRKISQILEDVSKDGSEDQDSNSASSEQDTNYRSAGALTPCPVFQHASKAGLAGMMTSPFFRRAPPMFASSYPLPLVMRRAIVTAELCAGRPRGLAGGTIPQRRCTLAVGHADDDGDERLYTDFTIRAILGLTQEDHNVDHEQSTSSVIPETYETSRITSLSGIYIITSYRRTSGVARIWGEEGHEIKRKQFKGDTQKYYGFYAVNTKQ